MSNEISVVRDRRRSVAVGNDCLPLRSLLLSAFIIQNTDSTPVTWLIFTSSAPLWVVVVLAAVGAPSQRTGWLSAQAAGQLTPGSTPLAFRSAPQATWSVMSGVALEASNCSTRSMSPSSPSEPRQVSNVPSSLMKTNAGWLLMP